MAITQWWASFDFSIKIKIKTFEKSINLSRLKSRLSGLQSWYRDWYREFHDCNHNIETGIKTFRIAVLILRFVSRLSGLQSWYHDWYWDFFLSFPYFNRDGYCYFENFSPLTDNGIKTVKILISNQYWKQDKLDRIGPVDYRYRKQMKELIKKTFGVKPPRLDPGLTIVYRDVARYRPKIPLYH